MAHKITLNESLELLNNSATVDLASVRFKSKMNTWKIVLI